MIDLRCGDWRDVLADVGEVDALICDPPYGARCHAGNTAEALEAADDSKRRELSYTHWGADDVAGFLSHWNSRARGWIVAMSCSDLAPVWRAEAEKAGRYAFAPVPCVIRAMTVRLTGDGPSSWSVMLNVSRPKTAEAAKWGTLPGAYVTNRATGGHIGGKPEKLMNAIIRDYTRPGDLVCDPCAGMATTAIACSSLGRRFVGSEIDPETYAKAQKRLAGGQQMDMFGGVE